MRMKTLLPSCLGFALWLALLANAASAQTLGLSPGFTVGSSSGGPTTPGSMELVYANLGTGAVGFQADLWPDSDVSLTPHAISHNGLQVDCVAISGTPGVRLMVLDLLGNALPDEPRAYCRIDIETASGIPIGSTLEMAFDNAITAPDSTSIDTTDGWVEIGDPPVVLIFSPQPSPTPISFPGGIVGEQVTTSITVGHSGTNGTGTVDGCAFTGADQSAFSFVGGNSVSAPPDGSLVLAATLGSGALSAILTCDLDDGSVSPSVSWVLAVPAGTAQDDVELSFSPVSGSVITFPGGSPGDQVSASIAVGHTGVFGVGSLWGCTVTGPAAAAFAIPGTGSIAAPPGGELALEAVLGPSESTATLSCNLTDASGANGVSWNLVAPAGATGPASIIDISAGGNRTCALYDNGTVKCWGDNSYGELGDGTWRDQPSPVTMPGINTATAISVGQDHLCMVLADQTVKCIGEASAWGASIEPDTPVTIQGLGGVTKVAAGSGFTCALIADGRVKCWGVNTRGALGTGDANSRTAPTDVMGLDDVTDLFAGEVHACAVRVTGEVYCWGGNSNGQVGSGDTQDQLAPVEVVGVANAIAVTAGAATSCALLQDHTVACWGSMPGDAQSASSLTPVTVAGVDDATVVRAGYQHVCAVRINGHAVCWGSNSHGQLGDGQWGTLTLEPVAVSKLTTAESIAGGVAHTCAMLTNGGFECWGANESGQVGTGEWPRNSAPTSVQGLTGAIPVGEVAGNTTCSPTINGTVQCWGGNVFGQVTAGPDSRYQPTAMARSGFDGASKISTGLYHSCALMADRTVRCIGSSANGWLGNGQSSGDTAYAPVTVTGLADVVDLSSSTQHSCAVRADGTVHCWGNNGSQQLGNGSVGSMSAVPVQVQGVGQAESVAVGAEGSCAVIAGGGVSCWGNLSQVDTSALQSVIRVSTGDRFACALQNDGHVACWGRNLFGELGNGSTGSSLQPPGVVQNLDDAVWIETGSSHVCAVRSSGSVACWGSNYSGEVNPGNASDVEPLPVDVAGIDAAVAVTAGRSHSCAWLSDRTIKCWGSYNEGQLGDGRIGLVLRPLPGLVFTPLNEGFNNIANLPGWYMQNNSEPKGPASWFQGGPQAFAAHNGPANSYIAVNFQSVDEVGTISNWLVTPELTLVNDAEFSFWTRVPDQSYWPDRLELRLSTQGSSTDVGSSADSVGAFTRVLLSINENQEDSGYPQSWKQYSVILDGLPASGTTGRFAFRYHVTGGGSDLDNPANFVGIDTVRYADERKARVALGEGEELLAPTPGFPYSVRRVTLDNSAGTLAASNLVVTTGGGALAYQPDSSCVSEDGLVTCMEVISTTALCNATGQSCTLLSLEAGSSEQLVLMLESGACASVSIPAAVAADGHGELNVCAD